LIRRVGGNGGGGLVVLLGKFFDAGEAGALGRIAVLYESDVVASNTSCGPNFAAYDTGKSPTVACVTGHEIEADVRADLCYSFLLRGNAHFVLLFSFRGRSFSATAPFSLFTRTAG
jgi:hypothetical protein